MEIARKGLTRLVSLLGKGSQQEQLQRAAARNQPFEQLVVKGWLSRGCSLLGGLWGREMSQHSGHQLSGTAAAAAS